MNQILRKFCTMPHDWRELPALNVFTTHFVIVSRHVPINDCLSLLTSLYDTTLMNQILGSLRQINKTWFNALENLMLTMQIGILLLYNHKVTVRQVLVSKK